MKVGLLCTASFCALSMMGFVAWRVYAARCRETPHFEIVKDYSASDGDGCESLLGLAEQVLQRNDAAAGSMLTVLILGDQRTANEPWKMGAYPIPTIRRVLEGRSAKLRREEDILRDISGKCQSLRRTTVSPIFLGVTQGVADLRARECRTTSKCKLFVDTDLYENVESSIRKRLNGNDNPKRISVPQIDNRGIEVVFCGVAVTDGRFHDLAENGSWKFMTRDSNRENRMREVWLSLFTESAAVRFEPYCPNSTQLGTRLVSRASPN